MAAVRWGVEWTGETTQWDPEPASTTRPDNAKLTLEQSLILIPTRLMAGCPCVLALNPETTLSDLAVSIIALAGLRTVLHSLRTAAYLTCFLNV